MVLASEFIDPFQDAIVAFPITSNEAGAWDATIIQLIIGAVVFLTIVAIYNALFGIWQSILQDTQNPGTITDDLKEGNDVFVRVTFAILCILIAYLVVWYFGPSRSRSITR